MGKLSIATPQEIQEAAEYKAPWHFKVMVVLAVVYVGYRVVQMITWIVWVAMW